MKRLMSIEGLLIHPLTFSAIKQFIILLLTIYPSVLVFFTIRSIGIVFLTIRLVFTKQIFDTTQFFARKEMLNKFLIVLGTVSILVGVTFQFIFAFI